MWIKKQVYQNLMDSIDRSDMDINILKQRLRNFEKQSELDELFNDMGYKKSQMFKVDLILPAFYIMGYNENGAAGLYGGRVMNGHDLYKIVIEKYVTIERLVIVPVKILEVNND
ncbi:hypothetical protein ACEN35_05805 [Leuconostoc mesenteroides]|uniref:hypothetical protein n=1 Tax=Leuconostoc mesenteroides TaxID=1245 RepID=UPI003886F709